MKVQQIQGKGVWGVVVLGQRSQCHVLLGLTKLAYGYPNSAACMMVILQEGVRPVSAFIHVHAPVAGSTNGFPDDFEYVKGPWMHPHVCVLRGTTTCHLGSPKVVQF